MLQSRATACSGAVAFDALHAQQVKEDEMRWGWPAWPEMYQNVDSPEVRQFCEEHRDDVDFSSILGCSGWLTASSPRGR
ncbi:hypothetical protein ACLB1S_28305 [Escherichia coli]